MTAAFMPIMTCKKVNPGDCTLPDWVGFVFIGVLLVFVMLSAFSLRSPQKPQGHWRKPRRKRRYR